MRLAFATLSLALAFAPPARGQGAFEIGGFTRYGASQVREPRLPGAIGGGARVGVSLLDAWTLELSGAYAARADRRASVVHARARWDAIAAPRATLHAALGVAAYQLGVPARSGATGVSASLGTSAPLLPSLRARADLTADAMMGDARGVRGGAELGVVWRPRARRVRVPLALLPEVRDGDADGVIDAADRCPGTIAGTMVDGRGCAIPRDADGDGVLDPSDACADTPRGEAVDDQGCPLPPPAPAPAEAEPVRRVDPIDAFFAESRAALVLTGVRFVTGSAELTLDSREALARVAASLRTHDSVRVEIGGHTDSVGRGAANVALSRRRAESVRAFLVARGVPAARVTARGYGPSRPVDTNATPEGRARNRRVELTRLP